MLPLEGSTRMRGTHERAQPRAPRRGAVAALSRRSWRERCWPGPAGSSGSQSARAITGPIEGPRRRPAGPVPNPPLSGTRSPRSIAAVGDSITRGFDACAVLSDCPEVSWATGTDTEVDSLAQRLLRTRARSSWNHARSGARMADLPAPDARRPRPTGRTW